MKNLLILITILGFAITTRGQNRHTITATVLDSANNQPLEFVTVAVLQVKDSSLVSYLLTDKKGSFTLRNIKDNVPLRLLISYIGYKSLRIPLNFPKTDPYDLGTLHLNPKSLSEVTIKGEVVPITMKKDTIEFNAEAFKVRPNALVQDLLKKLPGMQVDRDGSLSFNGQSISKIKVDGRDFFANNYKIVTQNLDADMISKIQVYDDRENDPDHLVPDLQVKKIINLKFKKEFTKSTFGKIAGGGGTQDRYQLAGTFIKSINDLQLAVVANSDNLSGTNSIAGVPSFAFGPRQGIQKITTTAVNINDNFGKHTKVNFTYNLNDNTNNNSTVKNQQQFLTDTTITTNSKNNSHNWNITHAFAGTIEYNLDENNKWKFAPQLNVNSNSSNTATQSTTFNNFIPLLNQDTRTDASNGSGIQYQHVISYYHQFKLKGESLNIANNVSFNPTKNADYNIDALTSYVAGLNSDTLNRYANSNNKNASVNLDVSYHYPFSKTFTGGLNYTGMYVKSGADLFTYDRNPATGLYDIFLQSQSTNLNRNLWGESLHPQLLYRKNSINLDLGAIVLQQSINNQFGNNIADLNKNYTYLLPAINLTFGKISLGYSETVQQPNISDLEPITIVYSPLFSVKGNPNLMPVRRRTLNLHYTNFVQASGIYKSVGVTFTDEGNSITNETITTPEGAQFRTPINGRGRTSGSIYYNLNRRFKKDGKWEISTNTNVNAGYGHNFYYANNQPGYQDTYFGNFNQQLDIDWNDIIMINPSYTITPNLTKYELVKQASQSYARQQVTVPVDIQWPKRIIFDVSYSYVYNPLVANGFERKSNMLNLSIARLFQQKDKGEIRLTCYDLLNQSISSSHYAENNTIIDNQYQTLRRYFMLSYSYKFNKVTTKEKK